MLRLQWRSKSYTTRRPWVTSEPANRMKGPCRYRYVAACIMFSSLGCRCRGGGVHITDAVATVDDGSAPCAAAHRLSRSTHTHDRAVRLAVVHRGTASWRVRLQWSAGGGASPPPRGLD